MAQNDDKRTKLIAKAMKDAGFRAELVKNPSAAIAKELGVKLPAGVTVKVVEDTASVVHLVLPPVPAKGQLSDGELESVAGGTMGYKTTYYCDSSAHAPTDC